ncbi:hypothetical protein C6W88_19780 [Halomonas litopenaei]|uniref:Uncharacterized protein n=1 Tax=Halomonas litopenaei TaxID=2109328 RepID=A0ABX5IRE5_9GAMM|nr:MULTISPECIES: hypothetical protein [Halomonas]PTL89072.1 hypothetical protein C6W88_19780 [Halomonas litopenaei]PTL89348.1 hypothetical protein C6W89_18490 [Halomonas sp. SYSU XM8]
MRIAQHPVLIRIFRSWHEGISDEELYEVMRGVWMLGERRELVELAFAVANGVVCEVYRVLSWPPAGSTPYHARPHSDVSIDGSWEFVGEGAGPHERHRYKGMDVSEWFEKGSSNPILYVNIG